MLETMSINRDSWNITNICECDFYPIIFFLLNDSHITANEHNSSHSNILYRQILNRLKYENIHKK